MPVAALNVRPSRQRSLDLIRLDKRNCEVALHNIGEEVILYAPSDEPQRGYFGTARIADISPDVRQPRFMFIALDAVSLFGAFASLESLTEPLESRAYRPDGAIDFGYFSLGIRALLPSDQDAAERLGMRLRSQSQSHTDRPGLEMPANPPLSGDPAMEPEIRRLMREVPVRDRRLRWLVLEAYGPICSVCGDDDAVHEIGAYEVEVCHLHALDRGGPDTLTNAMPMCRKHHWAYDRGLFTLADAGTIIVSRHMAPRLRRRFNGWTRAAFPKDVHAWPRPEHLQFHRANVFLR